MHIHPIGVRMEIVHIYALDKLLNIFKAKGDKKWI